MKINDSAKKDRKIHGLKLVWNLKRIDIYVDFGYNIFGGKI